jgi:aryl-alcohol dehydrogenase-like predicted oxidoreductase
MQTRTIGVLDVSVVGLGCNQFGRKIDAAQARRVIDAAIDCGITLLDTSDRYGHGDLPFSGRGRSEEFIGQALQGRRSQVLISTKFGNPMGEDPRDRGGSARYVKVACERNLRRLGTDYIDLYQLHRPDPDTPVEETLGALTELVDEGKVREIGCSNYTIEQLRDATEKAEAHGVRRYASVQNEYSLIERSPEVEILPFCEANDLAFMPYFPLASGLLTGKYGPDGRMPDDARLAQFPPNRAHLAADEANLAHVTRLGRFARERGHSLLELAFGALLAQPAVASVIAGATRPDQVQANVAAASWVPTTEDLAALDEDTR